MLDLPRLFEVGGHPVMVRKADGTVRETTAVPEPAAPGKQRVFTFQAGTPIEIGDGITLGGSAAHYVVSDVEPQYLRKEVIAKRIIAMAQESDQPVVDTRAVFVVHGHDTRRRDAMFALLGAMSLKPIEWEQAVAMTGSAAPFIGEVLDAAFGRAQALLVLLTGDDEARLREDFRTVATPAFEKDLQPQPRPNVLFEAGMALGRSPKRTILMQFGNIRPFSDIAGRHVLQFSGSSADRNRLAERLRSAGCTVDTSGVRWLSEGSF